MIDRITRDKLIAEHLSSVEIIKPFLRGRDVKDGELNIKIYILIFTKKGLNIEKYPAIKNYLSQYKDRLEMRAGDSKWFELQASPAEIARFEKPKIIIPTIVQNAEYAPDLLGYFSNDKTSICLPKNINFVLAVLNSSLMWWFIKQIAASKQGGFFELKPMYVSQIPIPTATEAEQKAIETLVGYVLHLTVALKDIPSSGKEFMASADDQLMLSYFEQIIDAAVM
ncbi:MAG: type II restriction endonuclease, partial [Coleofasciculaceae cyanobacterium SM2_1_6]|nr:type II restriction endonuclease [Coleofasciculaceae cyanobacterium SM2_1_6]